MISVLRFGVERTDEAEFLDRVEVAINALSGCRGYLRARAGRSTDDPARWVFVSEWRDIGSYRRALGSYAVKLHATELFASAESGESAFEELIDRPNDGPVETHRSDLSDESRAASPSAPFPPLSPPASPS
ncbi:MAG: antibiotic biosynthesis monooxygenase [Actinobacteria bacterium]|nr:antibiotic biosynthesis monooxygenase [Actinomycetota bacterium]